MKLSLPFYVVLVACVASCSGKRPSADQPYKAIVVALTDVDSSGAAHFGLVEKSFTSLTDLDELDGTYAKVLRGGNLSSKEVSGSLVSSDSYSGGSSPGLRYTLSDDVVVSSDYSTLAMLSGYYQLDYIYAHLKEILGIDASVLTAKYPGGKHTVLFEPQIVFKFADSTGTAGIKLNAAFSPKDKQFLLFQRSTIENVPLAGNLQVISHEFGHAVFDNSFLDAVYDETNYLSETYAVRGINEGWADFVSFLYTGCADILRASIEIEDFSNQRNITKTTFKWDDVVDQSLGGSASGFGSCTGSFYCVGTLFARSLVQTKIDLAATVDSTTFALGLITSLRSAQAEIKSMSSTIVTTATSDDSDEPTNSTQWTKQGQFTGAFIRALIKNTPDAWHKTMCSKFSDNFGTGGFQTAARDGVCS